ncbi:uncharacterized protein LOC127093921 [Lathyrus oleraceus]|uniref:uncharacterized protein LOC127093921 n=1 Tax=Pisum sativum TaxID=3888 RepID=UPI0021D2FF79|nr:uncharacterized protein LOC127093921 [Pisum sativum]
MTLQESAKVMLHAKHLPYHFWAEAMNIICHIHNRDTLRTGTSATLYELWKGRKPTVKYFYVFGSKCYVLAYHEQRRKMDSKSDEGIFLGYSTNNKAYRVFNSKTKVMMESINIVVDDSIIEKEIDVEKDVGTPSQMNDALEDVADIESNTESAGTKSEVNQANKGPSIRIQKDHPKELIIVNLNEGITTGSREVVSNSCFVYKFEPKNMDVKRDFLSGYLNEEVYVEHPKGFIDPTFPNHVFKLKKALYGLKQAHMAWDLIEDKVVTLEHVATEKQLDDIFTKALKIKLERLIKSLAEESPGKNMPSDAEEGDEEDEDVVDDATSTDESYASADI